ncbi:MAG: hypothetical protein M1495_18690 [Bacteroidetes bacterium]|nr:hypothetical protein [Bacteroidota bacterium]
MATKNHTSEKSFSKSLHVKCKAKELEFFKQEAAKRSMSVAAFMRSSAYRVINLESKGLQ